MSEEAALPSPSQSCPSPALDPPQPHTGHGIRALANSLPPSLPLKLMISSCHTGGERNPISPPEPTELTTSLQPALLKSSPLSPCSALPRQADKEPLCSELCPAQQLSQAGRGTGGWGGSWGVSSCRAQCYSDTGHNKSALTHTSQPHSRRSPAHFSMENRKGLANQKKNPAGTQEIPSLPRWAGQAPCPGWPRGHSSSRRLFATITSLDSSKRNLPSL